MAADGQQLLIANMDVVERVIAFTCRRNRLDENDAEEFASIVRLRLVEDDYAIVRRFEGRSKFSTFMSIVIQRMLLDFRIHAWGKWHDSAEALRLGDMAVDLERLIHRDGRSFDDSVAVLRHRYENASRESLQKIADALPRRAPRRRMIDVREAASIAADGEDGEQRALSADRRRTSQGVTTALRVLIAALPQDDRLVLQLRFESLMTVSQIARALHIDQRLLYRRIEQWMRELRRQLEAKGFRAADVLDVIGKDFELEAEKHDWRPSAEMKGAAVESEEENTR